MKNSFLTFFGSIAALVVVAVAGIFAPKELAFFGSSAESELLVSFFEIGCLFVLSFIVFYVSHATKLPSFVIAIFFGIAGHNLLVPIIEEHAILGALVGCTIRAKFRLFGNTFRRTLIGCFCLGACVSTPPHHPPVGLE
jgi:hypothetical protein